MPANRNALVRYKTIDACLRNRRRKWTLEMLIEKVSEALYEYEGIAKGISKRSIQADIQLMRSNKLGYNAPIIVKDKKYYTYEDDDYSIANIPLNDNDLKRMSEAVELLKQFKGFLHFTGLNEVVSKLEDHVYAVTNKSEPIIDFEKNEQLTGLEHLDTIYNAILQGKAINVRYQSFKARAAGEFYFSAWWLKEFKNRWFAIGVRGKYPEVLTLALDRIQGIRIAEPDEFKYIPNEHVNMGDYYKDVIGVTVSPTLLPQKVVLAVNRVNAPYIITKPLHASQQVIERNKEGIVISLYVQLNYELEKEILGYGDGITVLEPRNLRKNIYKKVKGSMENYQ